MKIEPSVLLLKAKEREKVVLGWDQNMMAAGEWKQSRLILQEFLNEL